MAYEQLNSTITINILNFNYLKETDEFHSAFHLYEQKKQFLLTDALAMHFIELPKLRKKCGQERSHRNKIFWYVGCFYWMATRMKKSGDNWR
ncbi:hypothetical protein JCM15765_25720 [Paradesulfitobacterium aromaticivorans]